MREFAEFENLLDSFEVTEEKLNDAMFGENAFVEGLMLLMAKHRLLMRSFFRIFPVFAGRKAFIWKIFTLPKNIGNSESAKRC